MIPDASFTTEQLMRIREQGLLYMCACPAQDAEQIGALRRLYAYQTGCMDRSGDEFGTHARIAATVTECHAQMERCLGDVLDLEGWDRETLRMPDGLRARFEDAELTGG